MKDILEIGQIVNTFGIKGFVKVNPWVDDITRFENLKNIYVKIRKQIQNLEVEEVKYNEEEAMQKLTELVREKLDLKLDNFEEIIAEKVLQKELKNNNIYIDMFIAVREQIGVKEYFEESRSDTNDEEHNEYTNRIN